MNNVSSKIVSYIEQQTGNKISTDREAIIAAIDEMLLPASEARPKTAWAAFSRERRPILQAENQHLGGRDIVRMIAAEWKQVKLNPEDLLKYEEMCIPVMNNESVSKPSESVVSADPVDGATSSEQSETRSEDVVVDKGVSPGTVEEDDKSDKNGEDDSETKEPDKDVARTEPQSPTQECSDDESDADSQSCSDAEPEISFETFREKFEELIINRQPDISSSRLFKMTRQYWEAATDEQIAEIMSST